MEEKIEEVKVWATERGLYEKGDPTTQMVKLMEEVGELAKGLLKNDVDQIVDGIGDAVVVLINLTELVNRKYSEETGVALDLDFCLGVALDEIKHRKGKMINGTFVKDE